MASDVEKQSTYVFMYRRWRPTGIPFLNARITSFHWKLNTTEFLSKWQICVNVRRTRSINKQRYVDYDMSFFFILKKYLVIKYPHLCQIYKMTDASKNRNYINQMKISLPTSIIRKSKYNLAMKNQSKRSFRKFKIWNSNLKNKNSMWRASSFL